MRYLLLLPLLCRLVWAAPITEYQALETSRVLVPNGPIIVKSKVYIRGQQLRREPQMTGTNYQAIMIWNLKTGVGWMLIPKVKQKAKVPLDDSWDGWRTLLQAKPGRLLKTEILNGHECEVREVGKFKVWVDRKSGYQLHRETMTEAGYQRTFDYEQFTSAKTKDALFQAPADYKASR